MIGFYNVDIGLPSTMTPNPNQTFNGLRIFAVGDLNNDKMNDLVTVSDDSLSF